MAANSIRRSVIVITFAYIIAIPIRSVLADESVTHTSASGWLASDFRDINNPGCSIGSDSFLPGGRLMMGANRTRPSPMNLVLRKPGWNLPVTTNIAVNFIFSDGYSVQFIGRGNGKKIEFDIPDYNLQQWIHEITAADSMIADFGMSEPRWIFDLSGATVVVNSMGDCFRDHQIAGVSSPFNVSGSTATIERITRSVGVNPSPAMPPPIADPSAAELRKLEIIRAEAAKAQAEADKAKAEAEKMRAEAEIAVVREKNQEERTQSAAEQKRQEEISRGIQP